MNLPDSFVLATAPDSGQAIWVTTNIANRLNSLTRVVSKSEKVTYSDIISFLLDAYDANH